MLIFNGTDYSDILKITSIDRPMLAPQTVTSSTIEGKAGSIFRRKTSASYEITLSVFIRGNSRTELIQTLRQIYAQLDTDEPCPLMLKDEPDKYIMAILSGDTDIEIKNKHAIGKITFFCPDPYWYAIEDDIIQQKVQTEISFNRKGTAISYPFLEVQGEGKIEISVNNTKMTFEGSLKQDETLVIDSPQLTAYIIQKDGSIISALKDLNKLDFPILYGNTTNKVKINGVEGGTVTSYKMTCNSRWK